MWNFTFLNNFENHFRIFEIVNYFILKIIHTYTGKLEIFFIVENVYVCALVESLFFRQRRVGPFLYMLFLVALLKNLNVLSKTHCGGVQVQHLHAAAVLKS